MPELVGLRDKILKNIEDLESQIKKYNDDIVSSYKHIEKESYHIHSMCIHKGTAESGHYYTFIKDHFNGTWIQFNDIKVNFVDEKTVYEHSNGGFGVKSAYWAVYLSKKT